MTPKQISNSTTKKLVIAYKNKARCFHCKRKSNAIYNELHKRLGSEVLYELRLAHWHLEHGEGDKEFNSKCDNLINSL